MHDVESVRVSTKKFNQCAIVLTESGPRRVPGANLAVPVEGYSFGEELRELRRHVALGVAASLKIVENPMEEINTPVKKQSRGRLVVSTLLFLGIAAGISAHCYRYSIPGIDALGYAGTVALAQTGDIVKAHEMVYSTPLTPHLRGLDEQTPQALDMQRRAADPYVAATHFPDFAIKPLYVLALEVVHKLGISVIDTTRAVSALFYFGIAVLLWIFTRSWLVLIVMIFPETIVLGQTNDPDGMSCFFMLLGLWMVFVKRKDMGLLPLLLAIWVRPENLLLSVLVILALLVKGRLDWMKAAVLLVVSVGSEVVLIHSEYAGQGMFGHVLRAAPGNGAFHKYVQSLLQAGNDCLHSSMPLFVLLWLVCFPLLRDDSRWIAGITLVFSALRFGLFPMYEPRYYALFVVTTAIAPVLLIQNGLYQDLVRNFMQNIRILRSNGWRKRRAKVA